VIESAWAAGVLAGVEPLVGLVVPEGVLLEVPEVPVGGVVLPETVLEPVLELPAVLAVLAVVPSPPQAARAAPKPMTVTIRPIRPRDSFRVFMCIASLASCGEPQGGPGDASGHKGAG
jgi:hypothetical protein